MSEVRDQGHDSGPDLLLTFEELAEAVKHAPPPTADDVTITWDGRAIDTKEKLLAWLKEVEANETAGITYEQLEKRPEKWDLRGETVDWDWDPVRDPRG